MGTMTPENNTTRQRLRHFLGNELWRPKFSKIYDSSKNTFDVHEERYDAL